MQFYAVIYRASHSLCTVFAEEDKLATDYLSALNVGSGLNTTQIIDALVAAEQEPQEALVNSQRDEATVSISSFGTVKQNFTEFENTMSALNGVTGMSISQSGSSVTATASDDSLVNEFSSSIEISQLAQPHTLVFDGFLSESANLGSGTLTFEFGSWSSGSFTVNSEATGGNVTIESGSDSLAEVKDSINAANIGVTASILKQSDTNFALVLKSEEGAENAMRISSSSSKTVSQTTAGVAGTTSEIQSVAGFSSSDLSGLAGKTLFFHDGTNSLSVDFTSAPANLAAVVSAITSATGYSDMDFTVSAGTNALTLTYSAADGNVDLADVSVLSTGGPDDSKLYYLTNYDTAGASAFNPTEDLTVTQTTAGVSNTRAEVQSVSGFTASDISQLSGKTLFFNDGTNSLSVDFTSAPADLAAVVSAITSATGYSNMDFTVAAGTNALTLTYNASDGNVDLASVGIIPSTGLAVTQTTKGVTGATAEVQSVAGFTSSDISALNGKTLFFHDGTNSLSVDFTSTPADLAAVVSAITSATGYSDMNFTVSAGTNALTLTYNASSGNTDLADVGFLTTVQSVSAADANLTIDGISVTRNSNTITDLVDGVTLTLNSTTSSAETVSGSWDSANALAALQVFVAQMNASISNLGVLTDRGSATSDAGALAGDPLASYLLKQLTSLTTQPIEGFGDELIYLTNFGVMTELDGSLSIDEDRFNSYFSENPTYFAAVTTSRVTTDSSLVSGSMLGSDYTPGKYSFAIDSSTSVGTIDTDIQLINSGSTYYASGGILAGLFLSTETGASTANIYVGRSLSETLKIFAGEMLASGGDIEEKINSLDEDVNEYEQQLADISSKMETIRARYVAQFAAMDTLVAQLKSTETTITNMMESWKAGLKR